MLDRAFIIIVNLIPVYGIYILGWDAVTGFIIYTLETILAGIFTILKLWIVTLYKKTDNWNTDGTVSEVSGYIFILFFIAHYGLFCLLQTGFFATAAHILPENAGFSYFLFHFYQFITPEIGYALLGFISSYIVTALLPFIIRGQFKTASMTEIMFQPYPRIFIQQLTVILGCFLLVAGLGKPFILVFACIKVFFEAFIFFNSKGLRSPDKNAYR